MSILCSWSYSLEIRISSSLIHMITCQALMIKVVGQIYKFEQYLLITDTHYSKKMQENSILVRKKVGMFTICKVCSTTYNIYSCYHWDNLKKRIKSKCYRIYIKSQNSIISFDSSSSRSRMNSIAKAIDIAPIKTEASVVKSDSQSMNSLVI